MPALLTAASTMTCPHQGTVMAVPSQSTTTADALVLCMSDTCTITGCSFTLPQGPSPCVTVQWVQAATSVKVGGNFVLNENSVGMCMAATQAPQGTVMITATQAKVDGV